MFKPVHIDKMIHFTYHTIIKASLDSPSTFPRYVYHLTPLHQIESYIQKNEYFLDVLGVITQVSALKPVRTQTRESSNVIKEIIIKDINDVTMRLTLWAERAKAFKLDDVYNPLEQKPIVTLFVGCLAKNFQGAYLNGGTTCRWYFNPDIKEAAPYYQRFGSQKVKLQIPSEQEQQLSVAKETHVEHKTLHELLALDPYAFPKQGYECTVTIIEVPTTNRWWFPACTKCSRACRPQDGGYYCSYCKSEAYTLRYKLTFMGSDATATAQMFCFDTVARHIVGRPCETVLKQATEATPIPPDLAQIVSLKFTFRVTASNQTFAQREKQPTVLQINSIVVHGRQHYLPSGIQNTIDQGPSTPNKEATLKLLEESPSIAMERLSTKVSKDVGRKLTYSTQDKDIIGSQVLDVAQGTNADKGIPTDKGKEIEPHLQSPPKRHKQGPLTIKE
ncbi:replication factor A protein 1 [Zea mays]|uniref:replication factor A protein 1 n=1 Tax=Zea mays TaxID=4577 RepID=UPI0004DE84E2|nr:replication factor A protein 1 [Zea mays]|eukprot:XP_008645279.1 replication factor A protein 1 [Zea mays]